ncbi:PDDEXK nuclease domain-containing protein [Bacteroides sp.]
MERLITTDTEYKEWISELKLRIRQSQIKAAVKVNTELLHLYWELGKDIVELKAEARWGTNIMSQISSDLKKEFSDMGGFSETNLRYIKRFYLFYHLNQPQVGAKSNNPIRHQVGDESYKNIFSIPWGHQKLIITKARSIDEALFYVQKTIEQGWSRNVLTNYMSARLYETEGKSISNFKNTLPAAQSDLAQQTLKDPYNFDFLTLREGYLERELEDALTDNITKFLIEMGNGFAYVGRQVRLEVGGDEFFVDLLFYHLKLRSYVVIELKTGDFQPEYIGKLGFYVSAVDHEMKHPQDNPTIGLLICKSKNNIVARYTLDTANLPIGISEYELNQLYPKDFRSTLPSIEEIENELKD